MNYTIIPFTEDYLEAAVNLFINNYKDEQEKTPWLPSRAVNEPEWIVNTLKPLVVNPGVAVLQDNQLVGYMITGFHFPFKGQNAVLVPIYCHGSVLRDKKELYQKMYMHLADEWAKNRRHLHIIAHFAHDSLLQDTLYQLGFGAFLAERLRDFTMVTDNNTAEITEEKDHRKIIDIHIEHMQYYPESPIFLSHKDKINNAGPDLESYANNGDLFFVYNDKHKPGAYIIAGDSSTSREGFLLQKTNTAQIKAAFVQPHLRGKGIGKALLQHAIQWSQEHGYKRLFVEHETANYYGGNFWNKYFTPYLYFSLRYIDNTINY